MKVNQTTVSNHIECANPTVVQPGDAQSITATVEPKAHSLTQSRSAANWLRIHLSRVTSSGHYIPEIDGLRFVAIAWVVMFHLHGFIESRTDHASSNLFAWIVRQGQLGVLLFFVVSGFILGLPFAARSLVSSKEVSLRRYFLRRVTRLEPPYIVNVVLATAILMTAYLSELVPHRYELSIDRIATHSLASLLYCHTFVYGGFNPINWVLWSLEVEIQFYISLPLVALFFRIRPTPLRRPVWLALIFSCALVGALCFKESWRFHHSLLGNLQYFLAGLLLADCYATHGCRHVSDNSLWDLIALPAWLCLPVLFAAPHGRAFLPFAIMLAYGGVFWGTHLKRVFRIGWVATIGGMCYSIYLYHYLMILALGPLTLRLPRVQIIWIDHTVQYVVLSTAILSLSAIAFMAFERPFMIPDWPSQLMRWHRKRLIVTIAKALRQSGGETNS